LRVNIAVHDSRYKLKTKPLSSSFAYLNHVRTRFTNVFNVRSEMITVAMMWIVTESHRRPHVSILFPQQQ